MGWNNLKMSLGKASSVTVEKVNLLSVADNPYGDGDCGQDTLQWRHNGCDGVPNHQPHDCLLNRLFRHRSKKTSKIRVTGLCAGNSTVTQRASYAEKSLSTVYPNKYAHGLVVPCFVVVMQSFIINSHEVFIHIHQGCFAGTGAIVRLPQCQWSKPDRYGKIRQCITTTKHSKAKTVCIFLGIYCMLRAGMNNYIP